MPRTLVTIDPADVIAHSPNGWINDNDSQTLGNNVHAHADLNGDNLPDLPLPSGGPTRTFDFPLDLDLEPTTHIPASIVQIFYYSNRFHDRMMALGFDEPAGNFQQLNFTSEGLAADPILAEVQDNFLPPSGPPSLNNANFTSSVDGTTARVQMYLFDGPAPDRDGTLDGEIVLHELAHGTSIRLHTDQLNGTQPQAMGEGWSDFIAIAMFAQPSDNPDAVYAMGAYTTFQFQPFTPTFTNNYYFGIRRFPYSTDLAKNPQTYADIDSAQQSYPDEVPRNTAITNTANAIHNAGEVWCNTLMEVRSALWHAHGFPGNERTLGLIIDAMKLSPGNPNYLQARDAILQADLVNHAGADQARLWTAFAKRGMGLYALSPAGTSVAGIVENFDTPHFITFSYPGGPPAQLPPGVPNSFAVDVIPTQLTITPQTEQLFYSIDNSPFTPAPLTALGNNSYQATLPAASCTNQISYYISVETSDGTRTDPSDAPNSFYTATIATSITTLTDSFESPDEGWTATPGDPAATQGLWTRMTPQATAAQPGSAHEGSACWVTDGDAGISIGDNDVDACQSILTSSAFDFSTKADLTVSYWRWYSNNQGQNPGANTFLIEVSVDDGETWTTAEVVGPNNHINNQWTLASWKLSSLSLTPSSHVRFRFIAQDFNGAIIEAAIDELTLSGHACTDPCGTADFNNDGDAGTDADIEAFFACLAGDCCQGCYPGGSDFNADGDAGTDADIEAFFRVLAGGVC